MHQRRNRRHREEAKAAAVDPIAMTIAIWLGLVVCVTAAGHIAQDAARQSSLSSQPLQSLSQIPAAVPLGG